MADNTTLDAGSGGDTIATDDISGVKHQRVKVQYGVDGSATDVSDTNPLPVDDAGGSLSVDDGGGALTVDGTVAATQSGTWTVQPGNTANTTAWKVDGSAVTQPVSGTVTANLSATDNTVLDNIDADTSAIQTAVEAIQAAVEGTLTVTGGGGGTEYTVDAAAPAAPTGSAGLMERDDALAALTEVEGDWTNMRANANGALWVKHDGTMMVDGSGVTQPVSHAALTELAAAIDTELQVDVVGALPAGTNNIGDVDVASSALPTGASTSAKQDTIIGHVDGIEALLTTIDADTSNLSVVGGGTEAAAIRVTLASDSTGVLSVDDNGSTVSVDDGGGVLTVDGTVAVTGVSTAANQTTIIGHVDGIEGLLTTIDADTGGILTSVQTLDNAIAGNEMQVDVVGALPAGTATIGAVNVKPATSGGLTIFRSIDLDESEEEVKATAGQVYGWYIFNDHATDNRYIKFYNATAANVTVGTTTPVMTIPLSAGAAANVEFTNGIAFDTAITVAATTGVADNDTGAPGANEVIANFLYS